MTEIEIKAAAERLKLETRLDDALTKLEALTWKIQTIRESLKSIERDPAEYFRIESIIQTLFKNTQQ